MTDDPKTGSSLAEEAKSLRDFYSTTKLRVERAPRDANPSSSDSSANLQIQYKVLVVSQSAKDKKAFEAALTPFGFRVKFLSNVDDALKSVVLKTPDVIVAHTELPSMPGYDFCRATKRNPRLTHIPFILFKDRANLDDKLRAYQVGTDDFFEFPMSDSELRARMRALVRIRMHYQRLSNNVRQLEFRLKNREKELEEINMGLIAALEKANEMNDSDTGNHIRRVCHFSRMLAKVAKLSPMLVQSIFRNASLHDVGKVATPDAILKKEGKLTPTEMHEMKKHTLHGYRLLKEARADDVACNIALCHHEKWDGSGYPQNLKGPEIPAEARIVALADVFDALTSKRCYKEPLSMDLAVGHIRASSGTHFDPSFVDLFMENLHQVHQIRDQFKEPT